MPRSGKARTLAALDGFGDEVGGAADGHEVDGLVVADRIDGGGAAFGFADHAEQAGGGEHLAGELVHAGGGGGAGGADDFVADGVDRADVVDEAVAEVDGEGFAAVEHVGEALVGGVAAGEEFAGEQDDFAGLPGADVVAGDGVESRRGGRCGGRRRVSGQRESGGGATWTGPLPSRWMWRWRVAAQLGIMATGRLAAWVG